jgi:hypothetical protein
MIWAFLEELFQVPLTAYVVLLACSRKKLLQIGRHAVAEISLTNDKSRLAITNGFVRRQFFKY